MNTDTTKHKRYDEAFKRSAVEHWMFSGRSATQIAGELGINVQNLHKWKQKFKALPAGQVANTLDALQGGKPPSAKGVAPGGAAAGHSKKNLGHNLRTERNRFVKIKAMEAEHEIVELCAALNVSRSGYHAWRRREPGPRELGNARLWPLIAQAYEQSRQTYGSPRVHQWLHRHGHRCGRHRIARLMCGHGLRSQSKRRFRVQLTDSNHDLPIAPNRLREAPLPARRDAVWVADITCVATAEGWLYVAGVLDRHTRRCVGWAMGDSLATSLPLAAWDMAPTHRKPSDGLVHHSDRGVQYASDAYRQRLAAAGVVPSMQPTGQWLRQRRDGKLLEQFETRTGASLSICHARPSPRGDLRVDRNLLQPGAAPQRPRLPIPCGL